MTLLLKKATTDSIPISIAKALLISILIAIPIPIARPIPRSEYMKTLILLG